jgi:hypothetical protein
METLVVQHRYPKTIKQETRIKVLPKPSVWLHKTQQPPLLLLLLDMV